MRGDDNSVLSSLQAVAGTRHNRAEYNRDIIDNYILHKAREKGVRLPTGGEPDEYKFLGAFVETTTAGMNPNVVYCDLASLYPNNLLTLNASPETIIGTEQDLQQSQYSRDDCVWGYIDPRPVKHLSENYDNWRQYTDGTYKIIYDPHTPDIKWTCDEADGPQYERLYFLKHDVKTGFMTECVQDLIELKNKYRGTSLYESVKRITNSIYGVLTFGNQNSSFRVFDWRLGEAITLSGRKIITRSRDYILDELHERGYTEAYACSGDTDATAVSVPSAATKDETLRVVTDIVEQLNDEGYDEIIPELFGVDVDDYRTEIEVESYAPQLFIPSKNPPHDPEGVKKRYIQWLTWDEDDGNCDSISLTGLEAERSDTAPVVTEAQELFAETLRMDESEARAWLFPRLRELAEPIRNGESPLTPVCKRGGIGQDLSEYGTAHRRPQPIYRGAKYATEHIDGVTIQHGDKPAVVYIEDVRGSYPSRYDSETAEDGDPVDAVSLPDPSKLPEEFVVDWEAHWKVLKAAMQPLLDTRFGQDTWSDILTQTEQSELESFAIGD